MEVIVKGPGSGTPIWDHFLLKGTEIIIRASDGNTISESKMLKIAGAFRWEMPDSTVSIDLVLNVVFAYSGTNYNLLKIGQRFDVAKQNNIATDLIPTRWQKIIPGQATGFAKIAPPLHPLLLRDKGTITAAIEFVDITQLFFFIHGDSPWYSALALLKGTSGTIRVLAALRGHPFIWYAVIPDSVAAKQSIQPNVLLYPYDYGGIYYAADRFEGITTKNHDTSVGKIQCGGETLFSFLTRPISDDDYANKLEQYLRLTERYRKRPGRNPPALHHFREVLAYDVSNGSLEPSFWDVPFGFEQGLYDRQQILFVPQLNGADGGIAIKDGLKRLIINAIFLIYSQSNILTYDTIAVNNLILTCYSESGGNVFTAASKNLDDVKALICFEPQYMNEHLKKENKSLTLGKTVIPLLLKEGAKVAIIARRKQGWQGKYLPEGVNKDHIILLPDDAHYSVLDYPDQSKPYDPSASPVLARRYSRLLKPADDPVINSILASETGPIDYASAEVEAKVDDIIGRYRKVGMDDEKIVKTIFVPEYNIDLPDDYHPRYYTHNFIVSSGQMLGSDDFIFKFFHQALTQIG